MASYQADLAETQYVDEPNSRFAYRRFGPRSGVPLVMAIRFRGTIDHRDPALLDVPSSERDVIVLDNRGTGRTSGAPPTTATGAQQVTQKKPHGRAMRAGSDSRILDAMLTNERGNRQLKTR